MAIQPNRTDAPSLPLADVALNAAIGLERSGDDAVEALSELISALSHEARNDATLVPVYARALSLSGNNPPENKADLYVKLDEMIKKMASSTESPKDNIKIIRDFCLALHESLLNASYQQHVSEFNSSRRYV